MRVYKSIISAELGLQRKQPHRPGQARSNQIRSVVPYNFSEQIDHMRSDTIIFKETGATNESTESNRAQSCRSSIKIHHVTVMPSTSTGHHHERSEQIIITQ